MFKYIVNYIDLPYLHKVILASIYTLCTTCFPTIQGRSIFERMKLIFIVRMKKMQSPTHHYINFTKSVNNYCKKIT